MLFNRVLSLLEEKFFNWLTRNWNKNILMGELNMTTGSLSIVGIDDILFVLFEPSKTLFKLLCLLAVPLSFYHIDIVLPLIFCKAWT